VRVLVTSTRLDVRAGTQRFVRELARGLQSQGHSVLAYGSDPGQRERLLENDVIPVATDLENLPFLPDVIHAQHHLDAMTALTALPDVPALYHCNGETWQERPPRHPRIYRYLANSSSLAKRLAENPGIAPAEVAAFPHPVDLARFCTVRRPPAQPARALLFNSRHDEGSPAVIAIREAAARCGLTLDVSGQPCGRMIDDPEKVLPAYDIVFASGVSAIEALACGCAVVVLGPENCGEMVHSENFERLRAIHFSIDADSPAAEKLEVALRRYSANDCARVAGRLRREADFGPAVQKLVGIYEEIIHLHGKSVQDHDGESLAISRYLRRVVPMIMATDAGLGRTWMSAKRAGSLDELNARLTLIEQRLKPAPPGHNEK
jgi:hypothetical protein